MNVITFNPKQVAKRLLAVLPDRARDVIVSRYGLGKDSRRMTLESIGKKYGITRERVRQIESYAIHSIKRADSFIKEKHIFSELEALFHKLGGIIGEDDLLNYVSKDKSAQNHIQLLLVLGTPFKKEKEDDHFKHRWHVNDSLAKKVHEALHKLYKNLSNKDLVSELDIIASFLTHVEDISDDYKSNQDVIKRWLELSKTIGKNPLGEWGLTASPNIRAKGMRDYAFLVIRRHGSPIHFREVAKSIEKLFGKKAHIATTHNELIKDPRFVLVGRGLYALAEWGYMSGVVKDVIRKVLESNGPLNREQVIDKVLKERYVKENTIIVNLQNQKYFTKTKEGLYQAA
ncbi:MAG: sigma factor-like helix-turn-helix DNA-binding protein [Patescibacteria group bacterium]